MKGLGFLTPGKILFFPKLFASLHYKSLGRRLFCEKYDSNALRHS